MKLKPKLVGIFICVLSTLELINLLVINTLISNEYTTGVSIASGIFKGAYTLCLLLFSFSLLRSSVSDRVDLPGLVRLGYEGLSGNLQRIVWGLLLTSFVAAIVIFLLDLTRLIVS